MLGKFHYLALWLSRFRFLIILLLAASGITVVYALFSQGSTTSGPLIPALLATIWLLLLLVFTDLFRHVPRRPDPQDGWLLRWRLKCKRGLYWLLALAVAGFTLVISGLSAKLLLQLLR